MNDLTKNFKRSEFACNGKNCCGHSAPVHPDLVSALQKLRDHLKIPLTINSGFRCNRHNKNIDGSENSFHTLGMAADIKCPNGHTPESFAKAAETITEFREGGIGIYKSWVHLDVRKTGKARW